jgi:hypothetical protein
MRVLGRLILLCLLGWLAFLAYGKVVKWPGWQSTDVSNWDHQFSAYSVFWLDDQQTLDFKVPANAEQIRVQLTPTITGQSGAQYSVYYKVLNSAKQSVLEATRNYEYTEPMLVEQDGLADRFFERPGGELARFTSGFFIDSEPEDPVASIQIRLKQTSGVRVAVRLSVLERKKDSELPILWQRMHRDKRALLMAEHIYPPELVSEAQRRTALKYKWLPVGPEGVEGEAYKTTTLFIKDNIITDTQALTVVALSPMVASEDKVFSFVQDEQLPIHTLQCNAVDGTDLDWLELALQDDLTTTRTVYIGDELNAPVQISQGPALYTVRASALCQLTLMDDKGEPIESVPSVIRGYVVSGEQSLTYALVLNSKGPQPVRLDVRGLSPTGTVNWKILNQNGKEVLSGVRDVSAETDPFEAFSPSKADDGETLYQKSSSYIMAPADGAELIIDSVDTPILVNVFTRPRLLPYDTELALKWFALLPKAHKNLKAQGQSRLFFWQQKPLPINKSEPRLSRWVALEALDGSGTFELFSASEQARTGYQVFDGKTQILNFVGNDQRNTEVTSLVYVRETDAQASQKVDVGIDNHHFEYRLAARAGRLSLPAIIAGPHQLSIDTGVKTRWYINHLEGAQDYRIRNGYPLGTEQSFDIEKTASQEWVSFHYFAAIEAAHTVQITVDYQPEIGVHRAHTVPTRKYHIAQQQSPANVHLLNQNKAPIWADVILKFPLDEDLVNGHYRLTVTTSITDSGYVQASYVHDDAQGSLKLFTEVENAL